MLKSLFKGLFLFSSCFGKTGFELELLGDNFEFLSGLFTELLEWSQLLLLSSQHLRIMIIVIVMIMFLLIDVGSEKIDFPNSNKMIPNCKPILFRNTKPSC